MVTESRKEALEFAKCAVDNLNKHKYAILEEESELYRNKRVSYDRALRIWNEILLALREKETE